MKVGAAAYVARNVTPDDLFDAVSRVSQREYLIHETVLSQPALARRVLQTFRDLNSSSSEEDQSAVEQSLLSRRETEILEQIGQGKSNKEIARLLSISDQTVKNHITSILRKLNVNDRTAAVVYTIQHRWSKIE